MFATFILIGLVIAPFAARIAAYRASAQRVSYNQNAEETVLRIAAGRPDLVRLAVGAGLKPSDFASPERHATFFNLMVNAGDLNEYSVETAAEYVSASSDNEAREFIAAGETVMTLAWDRNEYQGALKIEETSAEPPLRYEHRPVTARRHAVAALWLAVTFSLSAAVADGWFQATVFAAVSLYGFITASIDHDTLLVDMWNVSVGTIAAWALVTYGVMANRVETTAVAAGVIAVAGWAAMFGTLNAIYRRLRGVPGIGFGDTLIVIVTVGVPVAVTGVIDLAIWSVLASMLIALAYAAVSHLQGTHHRMTAFALGPFLAVGWLAALPLLQIAGIK